MDGNGRWAKQKMGRNRIFGHKNGVEAVRKVLEATAELGIEYLTLYAFSTENWSRPQSEINALMDILVGAISREVNILHKNGVRLRTIGQIDRLPQKCQLQLSQAAEKTKNNTRVNLTLALSYSSKAELVKATQTIAQKVSAGELKIEEVNESTIDSHLETNFMPDPELMIRTSGECRISNFLLWQLAYAELYFTEVYWPDFNQEELYKAILSFQKRERRFGKISEQISN
ncbi:UNVERIFIED_CONTAM: hypothetical protein GTU68_064202 [Idotea baltica]|nr:hypothetical protein [Idotea baltica]